MTKKELIESEEFRMLPDDAEVVFATGKTLRDCVTLNALNLSVVRECVNEPQEGGVLFQPEYKTALVIDSIPYWYLKERFGIVVGDNPND